MSLPHRLIRILTLRCEAASALTSQRLDEPLALPERLALCGHLLTCGACRRFDGQLRVLREAHRLRFADGVVPAEEALSPEARVRIARSLDEPRREADDGADCSAPIE